MNYLYLYFYNLKPFGLRFQLRPNKSGLPILPHLLRQMPFRIVDYGGNDIFLVSMATSTIAQFRRDYLDLGAGIEYGLTNNVALYLDIRLEAFGKPDSANFPIVEATGGQTLPITFGIDYRFWK